MFRWERDGFMPVMSARSIRPEDVLTDCIGPVVLAGEGVIRYRDRIISAAAERAIIAPSHKMVPAPSNVALLGLQKALRSEFADTATAEPMYIRKSEAEVKWSEKQ
jgi:tRNA threonylcarbamoyladenosine biosynthesis protein TsaB